MDSNGQKMTRYLSRDLRQFSSDDDGDGASLHEGGKPLAIVVVVPAAVGVPAAAAVGSTRPKAEARSTRKESQL